jgi:LacI family transcriptional regulator
LDPGQGAKYWQFLEKTLSEVNRNSTSATARQHVRPLPVHRKPTMRDVARLAGVGAMTVSRVLSGNAAVSTGSTQRVLRAVEQLRYRPNELARAFRGQCSRSIGLIIPWLNEPFFATCAQAVTAVAREHGYSVIIATSTEDPETEYAEAERMLERHVDGIVVIPLRFRESRLTRTLFGKTPVVTFDRPVPDPSLDVVLVQNSAGARRIVAHLIEHGHKRIAFLGVSRSLFTINARFLGYRRAMHEAGLETDAAFECNTESVTMEVLKKKLGSAQPPTALFTSNTKVTRFALKAVARLGLNVPNDMALAGFDDFDMAESTSPPLTVVRQPANEMGRAATSLLFDRIAGGETPHVGNRIVLPVEIVLRNSCGCKQSDAVVIRSGKLAIAAPAQSR